MSWPAIQQQSTDYCKHKHKESRETKDNVWKEVAALGVVILQVC